MLEFSATINSTSIPDGSSWESITHYALRYDCFLGDVILQSEQVNLSAPWGWIPILDFELSIFTLLRNLDEGDEEHFEFTESEAVLKFNRSGDVTAITASYADGVILTSQRDLVRRAEEQLTRTVQELLRQHPRLDQNPTFAEIMKVANKAT